MLWRSLLRASTVINCASARASRRFLKTDTTFWRPEEFVPLGKRNVYDAARLAMAKQWKITKAGGQKRRKLDALKENWPDGKHEDVLQHEVRELLSRPERTGSNCDAQRQPGHENESKEQTNGFHRIELQIEELSSTGDGLARSPSQDHVFVIPFTLLGERVLAKVRLGQVKGSWSDGDLIKVLDPSPKREGVTPGCKYFATCSGCQLQMLSYEQQLAHKKTIVAKAFLHFSGLKPSLLPEVSETGASPLQYGYRTKLTPHFDGPLREKGKERRYTSVPPIGFTQKGWKKVMDIESCPIGTEILQEGLKRERAKVAVNIASYKNGATILLRETTERVYDTDQPSSKSASPSKSLTSLPPPTSKSLSTTPEGRPELRLTYPTLNFTDIETYIRDEKALTTEYIGSYKFTTRAGAFFQNNNSILPTFLSYIREIALPKPSSSNSSGDPGSKLPTVKYLLDAYSGSGLFALTLSPLFSSVLGIEIDSSSVLHARLNATQNHISNCGFIEADASALFADVPYPPTETMVVIDPPRKGCSKDFLRQLLGFGARRVVYVSCNVHSQARDVGVMVRGGFLGENEEEGEESRGWRYEIEILKGWDFFPQTGHVEGVCVLNRVEKGKVTREAVGERGEVQVEKEE